MKSHSKTWFPIVAAAAASALLPARSFAWSARGHETVGRIAQDLLQQQAQKGDSTSQAVLDNLSQILGSGYDLSELAPCADQIKRMDERTGQPIAVTPDSGGTVSCGGLELEVNPQSAGWHFIDIPISASPQSAQDLETWCKDKNGTSGACVTDQINSDLRTLESPDSSTADKQIAVMYLVHLVGDEHQPLHCATEIVNGKSDLGGNDKPIKFGPDFPSAAAELAAVNSDQKERPELHALWDQIIEPKDELSVDSLSQTLETDLQVQDPSVLSSWTSGDIVTNAALESFSLAQNTIYPAYHEADDGGPVVITAAYQAQMQPIAEKRIEIAGYRLMTLLKQVMGQSGSVKTAADSARLNDLLSRKSSLVQKRASDFQDFTSGN